MVFKTFLLSAATAVGGAAVAGLTVLAAPVIVPTAIGAGGVIGITAAVGAIFGGTAGASMEDSAREREREEFINTQAKKEKEAAAKREKDIVNIRQKMNSKVNLFTKEFQEQKKINAALTKENKENKEAREKQEKINADLKEKDLAKNKKIEDLEKKDLAKDKKIKNLEKDHEEQKKINEALSARITILEIENTKLKAENKRLGDELDKFKAKQELNLEKTVKFHESNIKKIYEIGKQFLKNTKEIADQKSNLYIDEDVVYVIDTEGASLSPKNSLPANDMEYDKDEILPEFSNLILSSIEELKLTQIRKNEFSAKKVNVVSEDKEVQGILEIYHIKNSLEEQKTLVSAQS